MLYLIGLGIWDEKDISLKGVEKCKESDLVYAELYTANWGGSLENLDKIIGKKIKEIPRSGMEENIEKIISEAKKMIVSILVPGDPLVATTHTHVITEARNSGVETKIIHSSSIYSVIAKTGLHIYKFGRTATVVAPTKDYAPDSFYDVAVENKKMGLHTLVLLDIEMNVKRAVEILLEIEERKKKDVMKRDTKILACSRLGSDEEKIVYGKAGELLNENLSSPAVIIIPGKMHFSEEEFIEKWNK
ncbi:MAG: diphthine synthase [Candidatus Aenigmarchaeota archaeon]|nr:diphthine synthase [Candidatus Aenigmarchaeota archaeon]